MCRTSRIAHRQPTTETSLLYHPFLQVSYTLYLFVAQIQGWLFNPVTVFQLQEWIYGKSNNFYLRSNFLDYHLYLGQYIPLKRSFPSIQTRLKLTEETDLTHLMGHKDHKKSRKMIKNLKKKYGTNFDWG